MASHIEIDSDSQRGGFGISTLNFFMYAIGVAIDLVCRKRGGSMSIRWQEMPSSHACVTPSMTTTRSVDEVTASFRGWCPGVLSKGRFSLQFVPSAVCGIGKTQLPPLFGARFKGDGENAGVHQLGRLFTTPSFGIVYGRGCSVSNRLQQVWFRIRSCVAIPPDPEGRFFVSP